MNKFLKDVYAIITAKEEAIWRDIDRLMADAALSAKHMQSLFEHKLIPISSDDSPVEDWMLINQHYRSLGELKSLRSMLAASHLSQL